jgi:hypothetical protein
LNKPVRISMVRRFVVALAFVACSLPLVPGRALAWGDEGHEVIALVADRFLETAVRAKITVMLASDADTLTAYDIASDGPP